MRIILLDISHAGRVNFWPVALGRPVWELRCGMWTLGRKLLARLGPSTDGLACFTPPHMAAAYRQTSGWTVNDPSSLRGADLLLIDGRCKAASLPPDLAQGPSQMALDADGTVLFARIRQQDLATLPCDTIESLLGAAAGRLPKPPHTVQTWKYIWELVLANSAEIAADFAAAGRCGLECDVAQPLAVFGNKSNVYVAPGAIVHPMVVLDTRNGPIYIDRGAEIHPFTRIEGPCYVGPGAILLGAKCRQGNSIGPACRVGGEVEQSILQGYSNKYHDGFLGHAYVGEWVNLGAMTSNSDLRNDYAAVSVPIEGQPPLATGGIKMGCLIGDHAKTSIGTLFNTGTYVGAMTLLVADGGLLPKCIPSFCSYLHGAMTDRFGRDRLYATAQAVMARRGREWTQADVALWDAVFDLTAAARQAAIR